MKYNIQPFRFAIAGVAAALAASAVAGSKDRFPISLDDLRAEAVERFNAADADGDGLVTAEEFAAVDARQAAGGERRPERGDGGAQHRAEKAGDRVFEVGDSDGDGQLSREEYDQVPAALRAERQRRWFTRLDANEDGALAIDEFPSRATRLAKLDANGDGQISRDEMPRRRRPQ